MKVAKLVKAEIWVRVIVDEDDTDEQIIEQSTDKFVLSVRSDLSDNIIAIEDDTDIPYSPEDEEG